ncbi:MAG: HAD-IB family phosphatase [Candidatus Paceibacterota bacterium]|jgi:HAD superfamily phosphoserine phosphatase-like hydrolase
MKKVAIFDIDGTIFRSSLLIELVNVLIEQGNFEEKARNEFEREHKHWLERKGDYASYINAVVKSFNKNIKGVHYSDFDKAGEMVIRRYQNHTYKYTRALVAELKKKDYYLLAITHSPKGVAEKFCKSLGFNKVYGRLLELGPNDCFTGKTMEETVILNKANIVKRAVEKEGLTLLGSIGVGDTESDIPLLEMVAKPICFNPNMKLYRHAKRNGWKVVLERKDVVYEIN